MEKLKNPCLEAQNPLKGTLDGLKQNHIKQLVTAGDTFNTQPALSQSWTHILTPSIHTTNLGNGGKHLWSDPSQGVQHVLEEGTVRLQIFYIWVPQI